MSLQTAQLQYDCLPAITVLRVDLVRNVSLALTTATKGPVTKASPVTDRVFVSPVGTRKLHLLASAQFVQTDFMASGAIPVPATLPKLVNVLEVEHVTMGCVDLAHALVGIVTGSFPTSSKALSLEMDAKNALKVITSRDDASPSLDSRFLPGRFIS